MSDIQLQLTLREVNQLLDALGNKPYADVYQLIHKIQQQANAQVQTESQRLHSSLGDSDESDHKSS